MARSQQISQRARGRIVPQKRSRLPFVLLFLTLAVLIAGGIAVSWFARSEAAVTPFVARTLNAPTGTTPEGFAYKGQPDAPVTVVEYGDFQCPSCAAFATQREAAFDQQYVETGLVRLVYHDFPLPQHQHALATAAAARAAGEQGKFWPMHDLLFERQRAWSAQSDIRPLLLGYADELGLDVQAFEQALDSETTAGALEAAREAAGANGVQATPTFEVDGKPVSAAELDAAVAAALEAKGR